MVVVGVGYQASPLVLGRFSFFLLGMDRDCTPGVAGYDLDGLVSSECVDASHHFDFYFHFHGFCW